MALSELLYPFPPIEEQVVGKTWEEIRRQVSLYKRPATWTKISLQSIADLLRSKKIRGELLARADNLDYYADLLKAHEIFNDPHASEDDLSFAQDVAWLYKINALADFTVPKNIADEDEAAHFQAILNKLPDPEGKIWKTEELHEFETID